MLFLRFALSCISASILISALLACQAEPSSESKTIFGQHHFQVLNESLAQGVLEKSMGAIFIGESDPAKNRRHSVKSCSGIQISPRHVLSNAHCARKKDADHYLDFYFNKNLVALDGEPTYARVDGILDQIYLKYDGRLKSQAPSEGESKANLQVRMVSKVLDFAIFELNAEQSSLDFIRLEDAAELTEKTAVHLLSYPNALPLTLSTECSLSPIEQSASQHDCASAGGSSGGLLFNPLTKQPLALHRQGVSYNSLNFYKEHQRSEEPRELATRECIEKYQLDTKSPEFTSCVDQRSSRMMFNRAITLPAIWQSLQSEDLDLFQELSLSPNK